MGRFNIKKHDTFIDMTPMSDVMVLLLTFFMLTSTFIKPEPIKVNTPGSVSEIKVPDKNVLTILIEKTGRIFMSFDKKGDALTTLDGICEKYSLSLSRQEKTVTGLGDNLMGNFYLGIGHVVTFENEKCISGAAVCPFRCVAVGTQRGRDAGRLVLAAPDARGLSPWGDPLRDLRKRA